MPSLKKYIVAFQLSLSRQFTYRANFMFGRMRELVAFSALILLFIAIPRGLAGYTSDQLVMYMLMSTFISALFSVFAMYGMIDEIADGDLINYLLRPINYFLYSLSVVTAMRFLVFVAGIAEVILLALVFQRADLLNWMLRAHWLAFLVLLTGGLAIVQLLDFIVGCMAFWTNRSNGPRWLLFILVMFCTGSFFPIDLFPNWVRKVLELTPFPSLVFVPIKAWFGDLSHAQLLQAIQIDVFWVVI
ncbi:ABC-2 family transporter protein, partial [Candidatus Uhrbacteria bacterium]|nr:ABC-2 family transporter protein [Candidatus Uhrbacteria bacterium]